MRLSPFCKRHRGEPAPPEPWEERDLPAPHVRVITAGNRTSERPGPQWRRTAGRLGIKHTSEITALADGARWIWNHVEEHLPGAAGVLDIYHLSEHPYTAAHHPPGEGTATARAWVEAHRQTALQEGGAALLRKWSDAADRPDELIAYLQPHTAHLPCRARLGRGQSIGSGLIGGACKTVMGRRLNQTGARWRVRRVERMAAPCCVLYGDQWDTYRARVFRTVAA